MPSKLDKKNTVGLTNTHDVMEDSNSRLESHSVSQESDLGKVDKIVSVNSVEFINDLSKKTTLKATTKKNTNKGNDRAKAISSKKPLKNEFDNINNVSLGSKQNEDVAYIKNEDLELLEQTINLTETKDYVNSNDSYNIFNGKDETISTSDNTRERETANAMNEMGDFKGGAGEGLFINNIEERFLTSGMTCDNVGDYDKAENLSLKEGPLSSYESENQFQNDASNNDNLQDKDSQVNRILAIDNESPINKDKNKENKYDNALIASREQMLGEELEINLKTDFDASGDELNEDEVLYKNKATSAAFISGDADNLNNSNLATNSSNNTNGNNLTNVESFNGVGGSNNNKDQTDIIGESLKPIDIDETQKPSEDQKKLESLLSVNKSNTDVSSSLNLDVESTNISTDSTDDVNLEYSKLIEEESILLDERESKLNTNLDSIDIYGRLVLDRNFQNILTMSKNKVKLIYSRVKNTILEYQEIKAIFDGEFERFKKGAKYLFHISIIDDSLKLYLALDPESIDNEVYPHEVIEKSDPLLKESNLYKGTRVVLTIDDKKELTQALELIRLTCDSKEIRKKTVIVPIAYAEKYRVNAGAVLRGSESIEPVDGEYLTEDYDDIYGELTDLFIAKSLEDGSDPVDEYAIELDEDGLPVIKLDDDGNPIEPDSLSGAEELTNRRQTAKNIRAAIALAEPIVYFFDVALDKNNEVPYVNIQQVLNDKFLGKMVPAHYFAIAEGSERIEELNFLALNEAVEICNANPRLNFVVQISPRLLMRDQVFEKLVESCKTNSQNLILALDCALLDSLQERAINSLKTIKASGVKLMADNCEQTGFMALTAYGMDFMRFDCRYYNGADAKTIAYLKHITAFCLTFGIMTVAHFCDSQKDVYLMMNHGVTAIQGRAIGDPKRLLHVAMKERKKLAVVGG
ncbi:MAG: EAL domain-containing protein [Christensenellaceae bacterium]|jgi:EAL domain-containing protein (putative c-di-GMP-specific phosphodiesterase class I)|nr:EAL domain-containing protein [Christensenellaceae bacterium]